MSLTRKTVTGTDDEKTIGSSVAPVARVGRRLQIAASVLAALDAPVEAAALVHVVRGGAPVARAVGGKLSVGRGAAADWTFDDPALSRVHFEISCDDAGCTLRDLQSHNGTRVNEATCAQRRLADGDLIHAGTQTFLFLAEPDDAV